MSAWFFCTVFQLSDVLALHFGFPRYNRSILPQCYYYFSLQCCMFFSQNHDARIICFHKIICIHHLVFRKAVDAWMPLNKSGKEIAQCHRKMILLLFSIDQCDMNGEMVNDYFWYPTDRERQLKE